TSAHSKQAFTIRAALLINQHLPKNSSVCPKTALVGDYAAGSRPLNENARPLAQLSAADSTQAIFLQPPEPELIIAPMTIGVAAICEHGQVAVIAADR